MSKIETKIEVVTEEIQELVADISKSYSQIKGKSPTTIKAKDKAIKKNIEKLDKKLEEYEKLIQMWDAS